MSKPRVKMPVADRAKQFMPFAAVRGLTEALQQKERELLAVERAELSDDAAAELSRALAETSIGSRVTVTYYLDGRYRTVTGALTRLDRHARVLTVDGARIPIDDISELNADTE